MNNNESKKLLLIGILSGALIASVAFVLLLYAKLNTNALVTDRVQATGHASTSTPIPKIQPKMPTRVEAFNKLFSVKTKNGYMVKKFKEEEEEGEVIASIFFDKIITHEDGEYYSVFSHSMNIGSGFMGGAGNTSIDVGVITYKKMDDSWQVVSRNPHITSFEAGAESYQIEPYSEKDAAKVNAIKLYKNSTAILMDSPTVRISGCSSVNILLFSNNTWNNAGNVGLECGWGCEFMQISSSSIKEPYSYYCEKICETPAHDAATSAYDSHEEGCGKYRATIAVGSSNNTNYPDLIVIKNGYFKNRKGVMVKKENLVYRFDGTSYNEP